MACFEGHIAPATPGGIGIGVDRGRHDSALAGCTGSAGGPAAEQSPAESGSAAAARSPSALPTAVESTGSLCPLDAQQVAGIFGVPMSPLPPRPPGTGIAPVCGFRAMKKPSPDNVLGAPFVLVSGPDDIPRMKAALVAQGTPAEPRPAWGPGAFQQPAGYDPVQDPPLMTARGVTRDYEFEVFLPGGQTHGLTKVDRVLDEVVRAAQSR
jgi:hypothetical protein